MKTLIKGAALLDGTGEPAVTQDLLIENEIIFNMGENLSAADAETVEAEGLFLTPGFIDVHSHSDFSLLVHPAADGKVFQGVTTEVTGNCGQSAFPIKGDCRDHIQKSWDRYGLKLDWEDLAGYRRRLEEKGTAVNVAALMGQGNIRASVMGYKDTQPTQNEMDLMRQLAREGMRGGAFGVSTGLIYLPGTFSGFEELAGVMREVGKEKGIYATHLRNEGDTLLEAIAEAIELSAASGASLQISHLKTWGKKNWRKCAPSLEAIRQAQKKGLSIHFDRYPYLAAYTDLDAVLPAWVYEGGKEKECARLKDPEIRKRLSRELQSQAEKDPRLWDSIVICSVVTRKNKPFEGCSLADIAKKKNLDPAEALFELLLEEKLEVGAAFFAMCEENLRQIFNDSHCMIGSDSCARPFAGPLAEGKFHPRTYGTFPRFLAQFAGKGKLRWEEAVRRMTGLPAEKFGFNKRGKIKPGYYADLVLFDPKKLEDTATFENPCQPPKGIEKVWVNGRLVVDRNQHTGRLPGKFLTRTQSS